MIASQHPVVCYGEVLWDVLPTGPAAGGAPMNVAYHLNKLGVHPALITRIGTDDWGEKLVNILSDAGLSTDYFQVDPTYPTGLVTANVNDRHDVQYDIVFPSAWDFIAAEAENVQLVSNAEYFVYGSLTSRNADSRSTLYGLLEAAKKKVFDINLRAPHYQQSTLEYLLQKADILKMNEAELALIAGWYGAKSQMEDQVAMLQDRFTINTLIVTLGADGALVNNNGTLYRNRGYQVKVADTIGSGDAFLAGFLHQLLQGSPLDAALTFASKAGAFVATQSGACPDYDLQQILDITTINNTNTPFLSI